MVEISGAVLSVERAFSSYLFEGLACGMRENIFWIYQKEKSGLKTSYRNSDFNSLVTTRAV